MSTTLSDAHIRAAVLSVLRAHAPVDYSRLSATVTAGLAPCRVYDPDVYAAVTALIEEGTVIRTGSRLDFAPCPPLF